MTDSAQAAQAPTNGQPAQPAGTTNGITTAGVISGINGSTGTAGAASNPTATSSQITNITLNGNGAGGEISGSTGNNFAEVVPSTISGKVFKDLNNNGVQDGADDPLAGVTIAEYAPNAVKKTVVGAGHADKMQIRSMVARLLPRAAPDSADAADALAIAITHAHARCWRRLEELHLGGVP